MKKPYRFRKIKGRNISVEFDFAPGKRMSTGTTDMSEAVLFAENFLKKQGLLSISEKVPTLSVFAKDFFIRTDPQSIQALDKRYKRQKSDQSYLNNQSYLEYYILPTFGMYLVDAITSKMIEDWLPYLKSKKRPDQELADNSKNKVLNAFRILMDDVKRMGYRQDNPAAEVTMINEQGKEREALPVEILKILFPPAPEERINVWGTLMWATYFSVFYDTGFRPGEIASLRVSDVYQTRQGLAVSTSHSVDYKTRKIKNRVKTTGKGYSQRVGLLYSDTAELLVRLVEKERLHDDDFLFRTSTGQLLRPETSNKHFQLTMRRLGFYKEGMVQYCLRHTYTTQRRGDMPDEILAISMGHTKLREDYDHQKAVDLIRRLDAVRDEFFLNRERMNQAPDVIPFELKKEG